MEVTKMLRKILSFVLVLALGFLLTGAAMAVIEPSGDQTGVIDTATIEDALNAADPGDVVELAAGDFYLYRPVEVTNFSGTFKGRGRTATTIHNAPNVLFQKIETPHRPLEFGVELAPLFYFVQSTVSELIVSDMRIEVVGMTEDLWVHGPDHLTGYRNFDFFGVENNGPSLSTRFERIDFVGDRKDEYGLGFWDGGVSYLGWDVNVATAIYIYDHTAYSDLPRSSGGEYTVSDCTFVNGMFFASLTGLKDATVTVEEDTLEYLMVSASFLQNLSGTRVMVENLDTYNSSLIVVIQDPFLNLEPSTYVITHNNIRMLEENVGWAGIEMYDFTAQDVADVLISHNTIHSTTHFDVYGPIFSYGIDGVVVSNNTFTGASNAVSPYPPIEAAIYVGLFWEPVNDWTLIGNNVQNFDASPHAPIYLGPFTNSCVVVGSGQGNVIDDSFFGTNIITGMGNMGHKGLGQQVSEAQAKERLLKKLDSGR